MATRYVETSALLHHLLGEGSEVAGAIEGAERLSTSALTPVEADRGIRRARTAGRIDQAAATGMESWLWRFMADCHIIPLDDLVLQLARRDFPNEPIRALDALHVTSALWYSSAIGPIEVVSLDSRVRGNALALGLTVVPK